VADLLIFAVGELLETAPFVVSAVFTKRRVGRFLSFSIGRSERRTAVHFLLRKSRFNVHN